MNREELAKQAAELLSSFLELFNQYSNDVMGTRDQNRLDELRSKLQRMEQPVTKYIIEIIGDGSTVIANSVRAADIAHSRLIASALLGGNNEMGHNFRGFMGPITGLVNRALGAIETDLWPPKETKPVLIIHDEELRTRCSDLLAAPGAFDRVIREATTVLESRIRAKVTHEVLSEMIPVAREQSGENLVTKVFNPNSPVLSISEDRDKRVAFSKILIGIFAYLRNPYHHQIDATIEWSWAWSSVGFIDDLLDVIDSSTLTNR